MVFGNTGEDCGTGVAFTRNPATARDEGFLGEYLMNAQGEDVVAGVRTMSRSRSSRLENRTQGDLRRVRQDLQHAWSQHYKDMQDIEFTIQDGKLFMLADPQRASGPGSRAVQDRRAEMVKEKLIDKADGRHPRQPADQSGPGAWHPIFDREAVKSAKETLLDQGPAGRARGGVG